MARSLRFLLIGDDRLSPSLDRAGRAAGRLDRQLNQVSTNGNAQVSQLVRDSSGRLRTLDGRFASAGEIAEHGLGDGIERGTERGRRGLDRLLPGLGRLGSIGGSVMSALAPVAKWGGIITSAIPVVASVVTTLEQMAPAAAVGVSALLSVGLAAGAVKIGMSGVGTAIKDAFNPSLSKAGQKQLEQTMKGLAPDARKFVLELRSMKPQFDALKLGVQDRLFRGLDTTLKTTSATTLPVLRTALTDAAGAMNKMGTGVLTSAARMSRTGVLGTALSYANGALDKLSGLPGKIVTGLLQIGDAAGPSLNKITSKLSGLADKVSAKLSKAFQSGALQQSIETAMSVVGQFGHVLGNVGTILNNVFAAVPSNSGGLVGFLGTLTSSLAKATSLPIVQHALSDLFTVMGEISKVAGPLLTKALAVLGPVLIALAPSVLRLVDSLGAGLQPIIGALGPVLLAAAVAVGQLLDAVSPLLPVVGQMIASLGPVLTPILSLVGTLFADLAPVLAQIGKSLLPPLATITKTLGTAFALMTPVLTTVLQQLGTQGLTPIISGLATLIGQMVTQYAAQWLAMFTQLLPVIPVLIPVVLQLAQSIGQILTAVAPLLPQIMLMATQLISNLLPAVLPLLPPLAQLTILFLRLATGAITGVVIPAVSLLSRSFSLISTALGAVTRTVGSLVTELVKPFQWLYDVLLGHSIIPDIVNGIVSWFAGLPGRALSALAGLPGAIAGKARGAGDQMINAVRTGVDHALGWIASLPSRARAALGNVDGLLGGRGKDLVQGFINGIESKVPGVAAAASHIAGAVPGTVRKLLQIFSPSRVMAKIGADTGAGMIQGLTGTRSQIAAMAAKISKDITNAFAGKKTKLDDRLVAAIAQNNGRLQSLAAQRDAIAARIAAAKQFAANTTSTVRQSAGLSSLGLQPEQVTYGSVLGGLQAKLARIRQFSAYISDLAKKGLNKSLLAQILQMGPDEGLPYASVLDGATKSQLAAINRTETQINHTATKVGQVSANAMFDSGKNAGKGFLSGLQSQEKAIEQQMLKIAKSMQTAIRKALGIKSPSTVLAKDGGHATEGIAVGMIARLPVLQRAVARVAGTVAGTPIGFGDATVPAPAGAVGRPVTIQATFNVNSLDPLAAAKEVRRLLLQLKREMGGNIDLLEAAG